MKDIVFYGMEFEISDNTLLNIRYKSQEQSQSSKENVDKGIKKERSIFPAEIIVEKRDKKTLRNLINLQKNKVKSDLYITKHGILVKNLYISGVSVPISKNDLTLINVEFREYNEKVESLDVELQDELTLREGRKQRKILSKKVAINKQLLKKYEMSHRGEVL